MSDFFGLNDGQEHDQSFSSWVDDAFSIDNLDSSLNANSSDKHNPAPSPAQLASSTSQKNLLSDSGTDDPQLNDKWYRRARDLPNLDEEVQFDFDEHQPNQLQSPLAPLPVEAPVGRINPVELGNTIAGQLHQDTKHDSGSAAASEKPRATTKKASTAKGKQEAVKVPLYKAELLVNSLDEAKKEVIKLIKIQFKADDRTTVASHPEIWVPRIAKAFDSDFKAQPDDDASFTTDGKTEWARWQTEHENKVWAILSATGNPPKRVQACAYIFFQKVIDAHKDGSGLQSVAKTIANGGPNVKLKCSERLQATIKALEEYSIVRYDLLMLNRLEGLVASPEGFVQRKVENMWVNYKKKKDAKPIKIEDAEEAQCTAKVNKAKKGRKRKAAGSPAVDENNDDADDSAAAGPARKKAKASPKIT